MSVITVAPPVRALIRKELREFRHHRMILMTATVLPIAFLVLPILNLVFFDAVRSPGGVDVAVGQAMFCFFLTPVIVPAALAAYAIIGERDQGTLEPLLTLPLSHHHQQFTPDPLSGDLKCSFTLLNIAPESLPAPF